MRWAVAAVLLVPLLLPVAAHGPSPSCATADGSRPENSGLTPQWRTGLAWWFERDGIPTSLTVGDERTFVLDIQGTDPGAGATTIRGRPLFMTSHDAHGNDVFGAMYHTCDSYRLAAVQLDIAGPQVNARTLIGYDPPVPSPFTLGLRPGDDVVVESQVTRYDLIQGQVVGPTTSHMRYRVFAGADTHTTTTPYGDLETTTLTLVTREPGAPLGNATVTTFEYAPTIGFWATQDRDDTHWVLVGHRPTAPPMAVAAVSPRTVGPGGIVQLDGTASHDHDGRVVAWHWSVDGETVLEAATGTVTLSELGVHAIRLTVTDDAGATGTALVHVEVVPDGSGLHVEGPRGLFAGEVARYTARADAALRRVTWQFPDGVTKTGPTIEHVFMDPGAARFSVAAVDAAGRPWSTAVDVEVWDTGTPSPQEESAAETAPDLLTPKILRPRTGTIVDADTEVVVRMGDAQVLQLYADTLPIGLAAGGAVVTLEVTIPGSDLVPLRLVGPDGHELDRADIYLRNTPGAPVVTADDQGTAREPNASGTPGLPGVLLIAGLLGAAWAGRRRHRS